MRWLSGLFDSVDRYLLEPLKKFWHGIGYHIDAWSSAWKHQKKMPKVDKAKGAELEFLPAVLEVQESPPSPIGRGIIWSIVVLFVLAIIWASFGHIDIVAVAQGKIIPSNHSKTIQPFDRGVISAIYVREGQEVKKGDILIELDTTSTDADSSRYINEQLSTAIEVARLEALIKGEEKIVAPDGIGKIQLEMQEALLNFQLNEHKANMQSADLMIDQRHAAMQETQENIKHLNDAVPLLKERAQTMKTMIEKKFASRLEYIEAEDAYLEKAQQLAAYKQKIIQNKAALKEAKIHYEMLESEFNKTTRLELAQVKTKRVSLSNEVIKAADRTKQQRIRAPIDGVVQQLAVHTVGGVVSPAEQLMMLIPKNDILEVEAWVQNKDIGFVNEGQKVEIKVDAFQFTKYGTINGDLLTLSNDSVLLEDIGYVFSARVSMEKSNIDVGNKIVNLSPGMSVSIEIKTGKRRLIEYLMNPILRGFREAARER